MRAILTLLVIVVLIGIIGIYTGYIHVGQNGTLSAPKVKLEGGSVPTFNVSTPEVTVGNKKKVVEVPTVDVKKPQ